MTSKVVLRRLSTILSAYLPPKHEIVLVCRPSSAQVTLYKRCLSSQGVREMLSSDGSRGVPALSCLQLLTKICSHPALLLPKDEFDDNDDNINGNDKKRKKAASSPPQAKRRKLSKKTSCDYDYDDDDDDDRNTLNNNNEYEYDDDDDDDDDESEELSYVKELGIRSILPEGFGKKKEGNGKVIDPHAELSGKMSVLDAMLGEIRRTTDDKVVLISSFTRTLDWFERLCRARGYAYARLDGSTESGQRQKLVDMFNGASQERCFVFLLSCKAGGVGINLIGANRLFLYEPDWNPAWDKQSMARVWRDGQKKEVYIYRMLTTGTIEEKVNKHTKRFALRSFNFVLFAQVFQRQLSKQNLSRNVILDNFEVNKSFAKEDLKAVFYLNEHTVCDTHDLIRCDCQSGRVSLEKEDDDEEEEEEEDNESKKKKGKGKGRTTQKLLKKPRYSGRNSGDDNNADDCSAILKQWEHIADCSKINDPIIVGADLKKTLSFAFYSRSDKKIELNENDKEKELNVNENKNDEDNEDIEENEEDIEDIYIDVNEESNDNENNNDNDNDNDVDNDDEDKTKIIDENEKMLYEDDDIFSDINID